MERSMTCCYFYTALHCDNSNADNSLLLPADHFGLLSGFMTYDVKKRQR